uniref:Uncharacterized protein n=1 Tax=Alexandrium catenella TaxID=2925 RepID=A0A7S1RI03_ALECA
MEERCASLETRVLEARADGAGHERGREPPEGVQTGGVSVCVPVGFGDSRDQQAARQDGWIHDGRQRMKRQAWLSDQGRQMSDLERKLTELKEREMEGMRSWTRTPVTAAAVHTPRAGGHGTASPLRARPQVPSIDLAPATTVANASPLRMRPAVSPMDAQGGGSPLRLRPASSVESSGGQSPLRIRGPLESPPTVVAPPFGSSSSFRPRFPLGNVVNPGTPAAPAAAACVAGTLATPRGSPAAPGGAPPPRGRAVASTGMSCTSAAAEVRRQSGSPVRQMMLITQKSFGTGIGTSSGNFPRS